MESPGNSNGNGTNGSAPKSISYFMNTKNWWGPLTFIAIIAPLIRSRAMLATAAVSGIVALLAAGLPFKLGLLAAALAGMAAGWWLAEARR